MSKTFLKVDIGAGLYGSPALFGRRRFRFQQRFFEAVLSFPLLSVTMKVMLKLVDVLKCFNLLNVKLHCVLQITSKQVYSSKKTLRLADDF